VIRGYCPDAPGSAQLSQDRQQITSLRRIGLDNVTDQDDRVRSHGVDPIDESVELRREVRQAKLVVSYYGWAQALRQGDQRKPGGGQYGSGTQYGREFGNSQLPAVTSSTPINIEDSRNSTPTQIARAMVKNVAKGIVV